MVRSLPARVDPHIRCYHDTRDYDVSPVSLLSAIIPMSTLMQGKTLAVDTEAKHENVSRGELVRANISNQCHSFGHQ